MNERIKQLAEQATILDYSTWDSYNQKTVDHYKFDKEKFAELIVRECMDICKAHPSRIVSNNWDADAVAPDIVHRLEEHFGVEE